MFLRKLFRFVPRSTLRRALGYYNRGEFALAAELFDDILQEDTAHPDDVVNYACKAHVEIGSAQERLGKLLDAVRSLERAVQLRPGYADVQLQLGRLYEQTDQPQSARQAYERALAINPRYFEARMSLARLLMRLERGREAMHNLHEASRSGPERVRNQLREIVDSVPAGSEASATTRDRLETLMTSLASDVSPRQLSGVEEAQHALREGQNVRAIAKIKELLQQHPEFPDLHNLLGVAYDNEEMADDAIEEFEKALQLNAHYLDARLNLGLSLFARGRDAEAARHLRLVAQAQPAHKLVHSVLDEIETRNAVR